MGAVSVQRATPHTAGPTGGPQTLWSHVKKVLFSTGQLRVLDELFGQRGVEGICSEAFTDRGWPHIQIPIACLLEPADAPLFEVTKVSAAFGEHGAIPFEKGIFPNTVRSVGRFVAVGVRGPQQAPVWPFHQPQANILACFRNSGTDQMGCTQHPADRQAVVDKARTHRWLECLTKPVVLTVVEAHRFLIQATIQGAPLNPKPARPSVRKSTQTICFIRSHAFFCFFAWLRKNLLHNFAASSLPCGRALFDFLEQQKAEHDNNKTGCG